MSDLRPGQGSVLLEMIRDRRKALTEAAESERQTPAQRLTSLTDLFVRLFCESPADTDAIARVWALTLCWGPDEEAIAGAAKLLAEANYQEVAADDLLRTLHHPAFKTFRQRFFRQRENGAHDPTLVRDVSTFREMCALAVEAAGAGH
jgi:hypothetical protein